MSEFWTKWEREVIDGRFPLRRFLNSSDHSAVFLTEDGPHQLADAAIKFIRADPSSTELDLAHWRAAAAVSHPHLIRLFEAGECRLGSYKLLFIVMEYAEQTLAQVLLHRALTFDEVRQMLRPMVDALAFLHGNNWVHRQIKPTNVCVVNDEVKLASDTIGRAGEALAGTPADFSSYDPPEKKDGSISTAGDIWSLAMTAVAALTQQAPEWRDEPSDTLSLPPTVPPAFANMLKRCLSRDPARRPTIAELQVQVEDRGAAGPVPQRTASEAPERTASEAPVRTARETGARLSLGLVAGGVVLLLAAVWGGMRLMRAHGHSADAGSQTARTAYAPSAPPRPSPAPPAASAQLTPSTPPTAPATAVAATRAVLHKEMPVVPASALRTVRGHIQVTVRVTVDPSGKVVDEALKYSGSSKYFARLASDAAKKWRFDRAANQAPREWLLQFEFTRAGVIANAGPRS
jgi:serine/threonine-protein kinase